LFDTNNKEIINKPKTGINVGEHVWIGMNSIILKDVNIADNVVIGACSLVNKSFVENYTAIAGSPAKIVKRNVNWDRRNTDRYVS
jgi:acetyltransferase-like isoleucine patch superfamily enzyme